MAHGAEKIKAVNRREMMKGAAAALGIGLASKGLNDSVKELFKEGKIYAEGDTFEMHGAKVTINKWNAVIDARQLESGKDFKFEIINFSDIGKTEYEGQVWVRSWEKNRGTEIVQGLPTDPRYNHMYFVCTEYEQQKTPDNNILEKNINTPESFAVEFPFFTGPREGLLAISDFYEADIGPHDTRELYKQRQAFKGILDFHKLYIHDDLRIPYGETNPEESQIHMSASWFLEPQFKDQGLLVAFHERAHFVRKKIQDDITLQKMYIHLENAYERVFRSSVSKALGTVLASDSLDVQYELNDLPEDRVKTLFGVLTELHYAEKIRRPPARPSAGWDKEPIDNGHPWDNANEMFASTASILHFFPNQFLQQYHELKGEEQLAIKDVVHAVLGAFHSLSETPQKLVELFPAYRKIAQDVGYATPF